MRSFGTEAQIVERDDSVRASHQAQASSHTSHEGATPRIIAKEDAERILRQTMGMVKHGGDTLIRVRSWWNGELRWARNRVSLGSDRRDIVVEVVRSIEGSVGAATTNQLDAVSLESAVRCAERTALLFRKRYFAGMPVDVPLLPTPNPTIWSDSTYQVTAEQRTSLAQRLTEGAEAKGMLSAGYIEMRAGEIAHLNTAKNEKNTIRYDTYTQAQCSATVRHPKGVGSGWAGLSSYDWSAIDGPALADRALQKCMASLNPVAIEPGRYTVILEPQAVCTLAELLMTSFDRLAAERGTGPFVLGPDTALKLWRTKLGLKILDERITISHDPMHPAMGIVPWSGLGPITLVQNGVLTTLEYDRDPYALWRLNDNLPQSRRPAFHISGGTTSMEEMIQTTRRGILVTRFSNITMLHPGSLLATGVTRDGLWLIENGKISKAIKNLRFTESPLFAFNQVEQLGPPVPVFRPNLDPEQPVLTPAIVPSMKINDFSFTSTIDAI
jgi:predicted Zn-dependent protease